MRWVRAFIQSPNGLLYSNGAECCALQICCPPDQARLALITKFQQVSGYDADGCTKIVDYLKSEFALAPKSFQTVIDDIVRMVPRAQDAV